MITAFQTAALSLVPESLKMVFLVYEESEDSWGPITPTVYRVRRNGLINLATRGFKKHGRTLPITQGEVIEWALVGLGSEESGIHVHSYSAKEYASHLEERARVKVELILAEITSRYAVRSGSLAMVAALYRHYNAIIASERHFRDDGESRAERWMECSYSGAGSEGFYSDSDYAGSRIAESTESLEACIDYLYRYCPLLMARWEEKKRAKG